LTKPGTRVTLLRSGSTEEEKESGMLDRLSESARAATLRATRVMFPHDDLPDEAYEKVVRAIEADPAALATVESGLRELDGDGPFAELGPEAQLAVLERSQGTEIFKVLHATAVVELYDNPLVWKTFGYEGPSVHLGGYVDRGFDDLDWLPDPPYVIDWQDAPSAATPETTARFNKG
jgi:hypothetical protein